MNKRRLQFRPRLEVLENRLCPSGSTVVLPISAFLSQQGTSTVFTPPVPDQLAFNNSNFDPGTASNAPGADRLILVDYTGQAAKYLLQHGVNLHTQITGFVTETPIGPSGLMEVSLNLEAVNALTWVADIPTADLDTPAVNTAPLELGYRPQDLVANPSLKPALSDVHFQFTFQEQVGAPLPDLVQALILPGGNAPPGFAPETVDFQSWGTGTLDAGTTVGKPGQTALVTTSQVGDLSQPNVPGTLSDGFFQEPVNIVPLPSSNPAIAYQNGGLYITDLSNGNDYISVSPAAHGGVTVSSNLGSGTFPSVNTVVVSLGNGNSNVQIGQLPGTLVNVAALNGNNTITIGNEDENSVLSDRRHTITIGTEDEVVVSVGGGNNTISTGDVSLAQQIFVGGNGNNTISTGLGDNVVLVSGNGNNNIHAAGSNDFIEMLGNGNNTIGDAGVNDLVWLGGGGNNNIDNQGAGSVTNLLSGAGRNQVSGVQEFLINTTISAHLTSPTSTAGSISSGLLQGATQFSGVFTDPQGDYVGTLIITTADGKLTLADQGNLNPTTGAFTDQLTVVSGTEQFAGASGTLADDGTLNLQTGVFVDAPLTGVVYLRG